MRFATAIGAMLFGLSAISASAQADQGGQTRNQEAANHIKRVAKCSARFLEGI